MLSEFLMGILLAYPFHETIPLQVHHWPQDRPVQILSMSLCPGSKTVPHGPSADLSSPHMSQQ